MTKPSLFCLRRSQLASAKQTGIKTGGGITHLQGHPLPSTVINA
jgi:hypothetical protein